MMHSKIVKIDGPRIESALAARMKRGKLSTTMGHTTLLGRLDSLDIMLCLVALGFDDI